MQSRPYNVFCAESLPGHRLKAFVLDLCKEAVWHHARAVELFEDLS